MRFFSSQSVATSNYTQPPKMNNNMNFRMNLTQQNTPVKSHDPSFMPPRMNISTTQMVQRPQSQHVNIHSNLLSLNKITVVHTPTASSELTTRPKWGEPTWFLFHTLSVKIKESEFAIIRKDILNRIYAICINLPCPNCANHAKEYLDNINFNTIQTKEDFKRMMWEFHNSVNRRKNYPFFPFEELDKKYLLANTTNIIKNFMIHFQDRNRSVKLIASDMYRANLSIVLKQWFNDNIHAFHP